MRCLHSEISFKKAIISPKSGLVAALSSCEAKLFIWELEEILVEGQRTISVTSIGHLVTATIQDLAWNCDGTKVALSREDGGTDVVALSEQALARIKSLQVCKQSLKDLCANAVLRPGPPMEFFSMILDLMAAQYR